MEQGEVQRGITELLAARGVTLDADAMGKTFAQLGLDSLHVVEIQLEVEQLYDVALGQGDRLEQAMHTMPVAEFVRLVEAKRRGV